MRKITEGIHWVGVNDREAMVFEGLWPIEQEGVSYNAYIIDDEKVALIDTVKFSRVGEYLSKIKEVIGDKKVDYLVINHMEPDHSSGITELLAAYPDVTIVGNKKTFPMLESFYQINKNLLEIKEGDTLNLGVHTLQFYMTPMVHWPESMVTYETSTKTLFSMDIFGSFGTTNGSIFDDENDYESFRTSIDRYYACIVGKVASQAEKALCKLDGLDIKCICPAHGLVWRTHLDYILKRYVDNSKCEKEEGVIIAYGTMYGNTRRCAELMAENLKSAGVKKVKIYDVQRTDISYIIADIWTTKGAIFLAPSYYGEIYPLMAYLLYKLGEVKLKNNKVAFIANYSWSGGADKYFTKFAEGVKADLVSDIYKVKGDPAGDEVINLKEISNAMAAAIKE